MELQNDKCNVKISIDTTYTVDSADNQFYDMEINLRHIKNSDFYKVFSTAKTAYDDYRDKSDKWEERYGKAAHRQGKESEHKRLQNYQRENADQHIRQTPYFFTIFVNKICIFVSEQV